MVDESGLDEKIKPLGTKEEIKTLANKSELNTEQDKIEKIQTYDSSLFISQNHIFNDVSQDFLIYPSVFDTFTREPGLTKKL